MRKSLQFLCVGLLLLAGLFVLMLGITGFTATTRGDVGEFSRGLRRALHLHNP